MSALFPDATILPFSSTYARWNPKNHRLAFGIVFSMFLYLTPRTSSMHESADTDNVLMDAKEPAHVITFSPKRNAETHLHGRTKAHNLEKSVEIFKEQQKLSLSKRPLCRDF
jgi:hypothetical protein